MAESIVASASCWIISLLKREAVTLFKVADQVKGLQQELELMQEYLKDADVRQEEIEVGTLIRQIRELVYDVEDAIDNYILLVPATTTEKKRRLITRFGRFLYKAPEIYTVGKEITKMQSSLQQMTRRLDSIGLRRIAPGLQEGFKRLERGKNWRAPSYPFEDNSSEYVVGLDKDISKLLKVIVGEENMHINILYIVGMGGSGKSTLARKLYNHPDAKEYFHCMAWVYISQEWSIRHILSEILRMVGGQGGTCDDLHTRMSAEELVDKLRDILKNKLYLIVLDDVWRREALEEVFPALLLGDVNRGSKIIITTRNREITHFHISQKQLFVYEPQPLSREEGWELLSKLTLSDMENYKSLGIILLKNCGGLPLAIVALAGILNMKRNIGEWQQVNEAIRLRLMKGFGSNTHRSVQDLLALSYEDLPYYLKQCFLYLGLFPEDCQIPAGMLTRMWIAEGLITTFEELSPEDEALKYLEELNHRCMIQVVRTNFKGAIKVFQLHDLLRDFCLKKAKEQNFLQIYSCDQAMITSASTMAKPPRRVALQSSIGVPMQDSNLRSLIILTRSSLSKSANVSKETINLRFVGDNFQLLRLLNLWGIKTANGVLPKAIGRLYHLRYLGIRASNILKLPCSIGDLRNLLTLDYRNIDIGNDEQVEIPNVLWKLGQLRNLFLPTECAWNTQEELQLSGLENLRILWGIRSDGGDLFTREMASLLSINVKKLKVVASTQKDMDAMFSCPELKSHQLQTFQCQWGDNIVLRQVNPIFACNQHLSKLQLIGQVQVTNLSLILPSNLVVLQLENSIVCDDPMAAIGTLVHLKRLKLSNAYKGTTLMCKIGSFPILEDLHLEKLHNLGNWVVDKGSMLNLKKVQILDCRKLQHFPQGLVCIRTLHVFEYIGVPTNFIEEATACGWLRKKLRQIHNFDAIIEQCVFPFDFSTINKIYEQLESGVFLNNKNQIYWVVKENEHYHNCFRLYATFLSPVALSIYDGKINNWEWIEVKESDGTITKLIQINKYSEFFEVGGKFPIDNLSRQLTYQVEYSIMLPAESKKGSSYPASSRILLSSGRLLQQILKVDDIPRGEWVRLLIGEFDTPPESNGETIEFRLRYSEPLVTIKDVIISPKL